MKRTLLTTVVTLSLSLSAGLFNPVSAKSKTIETSMAVFGISVGAEEFPVSGSYIQLFAETLSKSKYLAMVQPSDVRRLLSKGAMHMAWVTPTQLARFQKELNAAADLLIQNTKAAITVPLGLSIDSILVQFEQDAMWLVSHFANLLACGGK